MTHAFDSEEDPNLIPRCRESDRFFLHALFRYGPVPASACLDKAFLPRKNNIRHGEKRRTA